MWTKERIHALLDQKENAVWRAVLAIYDRQTANEKDDMATTIANGVGFSAFDAEFMSGMAIKLRKGWPISPKQLVACRNKIKKYHRQLIEIANANAVEVGTPVSESAVDDDCEIERVVTQAEEREMDADAYRNRRETWQKSYYYS